MGRGSSIERALSDAIELRGLARDASDRALRARLGRIAELREGDIGPSVPKLRAAKALGVSLTALETWIGRGAIPVVRRGSSTRLEVESGTVIDLAVEIGALRGSGRTRGLLAAALAQTARAPAMGTRGFFPDQAAERQREFAQSPGERVAQGISLSRSATRIAVAAAEARSAKGLA